MSDTIIQVENLSKKYIIGHQQQGRYTALRDVLANSTKSLLKNIHNPKFKAHNSQKEDFWALKDVSFEIKQGDRVGIIGRNGAGKSTLLKILSRITEPTSGRISINGRVASLLEVGTGFHPELTGRENIYLNGAILGMSKAEIKRKFDEIVDFAEVEKFLDTPVKHYSSGMYVRLAFAVAAHLEPEILIVDEVLAVGDVQFQKKCLGKMEAIAEKEGRTILFVSHNIQAISNLCQRGILLANGQLVADGETMKTMEIYSNQLHNPDFSAKTEIKNTMHRRGSGELRFSKVKVKDINGNETSYFKMGDTIRFHLDFQVFSSIDRENIVITIGLKSGKTREFVTTTWHEIKTGKLTISSTRSVIIEFPSINLRPGDYPLYFNIMRYANDIEGIDTTSYDVVDDIISPLTITSAEISIAKLKFNPSEPIGYYDLTSNVIKV